jgi:hypothetical protein
MFIKEYAMHEEPTNLYRVVAQTLQWVHGLTSMRYDIKTIRIAKIEHNGETHYSFDIVTNGIRLGRIKHPMGLIVDTIHIAMTGQLYDVPDDIVFGPKGIAVIEIEDMFKLLLKTDNSGLSNVSVQTKFDLFDGGEEGFARHFMYKNNMLFQIR